jgi:hypothetical protein
MIKIIKKDCLEEGNKEISEIGYMNNIRRVR